MKKKLKFQINRNIRVVLIGLVLLMPGLISVSQAGNSGLVRMSSDARINVTGTVKDSKGEPLPGVSVKIKGTNTGTSTDVNGVFKVNLPTGNETLVLTYIGFKTREVAVGGKTNLTIVLTESSNDLDEVVVVGYGTQKKIHTTGSVGTVNVKDIESIPTLNLSSALKGQLPGISISGGTVRPGENASITIRNPVFFSRDGQTDPLYVIDDVFRTANDFNLLDQSEIENISVLKDAAAAIYGIQGANGVVIVRTKRGKAGAPKVSYSGSLGVTDATKLPNMMSAYELATYLNDFQQAKNNFVIDENGYKNGSLTDKVKEYYTPDELDYFKNNSHDWLGTAWQSSYITHHSLNVSGGTEKATYFAGGSYVKQNSNFDGVSTDKWTYRASTDATLGKGLKVGLSVSGAVNKNKRFWFKQGSESLDNDILSLVQVAPWQEYFIDGNPVLLTSSTNGSSENTNFFLIQQSDNYTLSNTYLLNALANVSYDVPFVKGLKLSGSYNRNINNVFNKQYGSKFNFYQYGGTGQNNHIPGGSILKTVSITNGDKVRLNPTFTDGYQLNGMISYDHKFGKHQISAIALYEQQESNYEGVAAEVTGVIPGAYDNQNFTTGTQSSNQSTLVGEKGRASYAGRLNYNYVDKYLVELAFRADANVNFKPGKQWGYFPSMSLGWVGSQEDFFKNTFGFVDYFKLRASIGLLGNDSTKGFQYQTNYSFGTGSAGGAVFGELDRGLGLAPNIAIANENVTWDHNLKTNYGIDMAFLKNKLSISADYFFEHRWDMLTSLSSSVSVLIGAPTPTENFGSVNTFGYEISVSWKDKIGKNFSYSFSPYFAWNDNKYLKYDVPSGDKGTFKDLTGKSGDSGVLGYKYLGMFRTQTDVDNYLAEHPGYKILGNAPKPGMLYYEDVRGPKDASGQYTAPDGIITEADQTYLTGKADNHYSLGLNFGTAYKSLSLNVVMGMSFGGQTQVEGAARKLATATSNRPAFWSDHWTPDNTDAKYPNPYYNSDYDVASNFWFKSSFSFRMSSFNLTYTLPTSFSSKLGVASVKAYLTGTNPINFYNPFDYRDNAASYTTYPNLQTYSFGLNVGF